MHPMVTIALRAARQAAEFIDRARDDLDKLDVKQKDVNDYVSEVDRRAEEMIISTLQKAYPEHSILGEESGAIEGSGEGKDYQWIIDPLDGTTNFLHDFTHYAVSIACKYKGRLEHAVIVDPIRQDEFTATRGQGTAYNGRRVRVSKIKGLDGALLGTGFPFKPSQQKHMDAYLKMFKDQAQSCAGIRRAGSAALDLAYVAAGKLDGFWEIGLNEWDIAAGVLLVQEAGGLVSDFSGGHNYMDNGNIICGNAKVLKGMLQNIQPHLTDALKN